MPIIHCDIRKGRTEKQQRKLCSELTRVVHEATGAPIECIFIVLRELPGFSFVDGGEHLPDYVPGPSGEDMAGAALIRKRQERAATNASE